MLSVHDTMTGTDYYKLHYSYEDMPFLEVERGPLELDEARKLYTDYTRNTSYTHIYVTRDNMVDGTSIQLRGDF